MKITICGSMSAAKNMLDASDFLRACGITCNLPEDTEGYVSGKIPVETFGGSGGAQRKIDHNLIWKHCDKILAADAILVINARKRDFDHYIGGNTFLEMGFAYILGKKIFLLNPIPNEPLFREEMEAMQPIILDGDLHNLRKHISLFQW